MSSVYFLYINHKSIFFFSYVHCLGFVIAHQLQEAAKAKNKKIPVTVVPCAALGYVIERVDMVLVGAEAVAESGGIVNKLGTYPMAMVAKLFNKPVYCAVESYKFARVYPLTQADLPKHKETPLEHIGKILNIFLPTRTVNYE